MDTWFARTVTWLLRLFGVFALAAGAYYWLFTSTPLLDLPVGLLAAGVLLLVVPEILWVLRGPEP